MHWVKYQKDGSTNDAVDDVCFQTAGRDLCRFEVVEVGSVLEICTATIRYDTIVCI